MKPGKRGLERLLDATIYSGKGLKAAWKYESAFRQEIALVIVLLPVAVLIARNIEQFLLLIIPLFVLLTTELLNSAIEAAVDRVGNEPHKLSGQAKDMGSAAVFINLLLALLVWVLIIFKNYG